MKMVRLVGVEWGFTSETYDFYYACVITDGAKIIHRIPGGRLAYTILRMFYRTGSEVDYGHGYANRESMFVDLRRGVIPEDQV